MFFIAELLRLIHPGPGLTGQLNLYGAYAYNLGQAIADGDHDHGDCDPDQPLVRVHHGSLGTESHACAGFTLLVVAFGFLGLTSVIPDVPFQVFMVAYLCVYACTSMTGGNMQTLGSDIAPPRLRGKFYGISQTLGNVGGPLATSAFAVLSATVGYWSAFAFLGLTSGSAAFILATQVRDRLRDERRAAATAAPS